ALLHCFDGSSLRTMRQAKRMGTRTVYEVTLPFTHQRLADDERERNGMRRVAPPSPWWARREAAEWREADFLIAQSQMTVDMAVDLGVERRRIGLIPLGVDTSHFRPKRELKGRKFTVL